MPLSHNDPDSRTGALRATRKLVMLCLVALMLAAAGCGSGSSSSSSSSGASSGATSTASVGHLPTAKFVLHAGLAFGAFHRYIYKPFKAGDLHGFTHKLTIIKAALAGLFIYHELKLAIKDAQASPKLAKLVAPVTALAARLKALGASVKSGNADTSSIDSANGSISSLSNLAKQSGLSVPAQEPSAGQLAGSG
jgi:hypothetical protein